MTLCLPSRSPQLAQLAQLAPDQQFAGSQRSLRSRCSSVLPTWHKVPAWCRCRSSSATLINPLCNFIHFKAPCSQLPARNLTLHKSISEGAGEQGKLAPFALAGQSWAARAKGCGAGGGSLSPATTCPPCKPRGAGRSPGGRKQEHITGEQARVAPVPGASLALICGD